MNISKTIKNIKYTVSSLINRLFGSISPKQAKIIKQFYYALLGVLVLGSLLIGISMGKDSAQIKLPPLAEHVNDVFEFELKREIPGGDMDLVPDSDILAEEQNRPGKIIMPAREALTMEYENSVLDDIYDRPSHIPEMSPHMEPVEGGYADDAAIRKEPSVPAPEPVKSETESYPALSSSLKPLPVPDSGAAPDRSGDSLKPVKNYSGIIDD